MHSVRVGHVRYLNAWPLVEGLEAMDGVTLTAAAPSELIGLLRERRVDVALVSTADVAQSPQPLSLLRSGGIISRGEIRTVRLLSETPIDRVEVVHADTESHTSVALCRLLIAERSGRVPQAEPFRIDGREWPPTLLAIGDKVVTTPPPAGRYAHELDLGAAWTALTGLPMVYAAWACLTERSGEAWVGRTAALLDRQRRHNATRLAAIAAAHASDHGWRAADALDYYSERVHTALDDEARRGLESYLTRAAGSGVLPNAEVRWAHDSPATA